MAGKIIVIVAVLSVFVVLCMGLYTLWVGGETARTWSNKLMLIRVQPITCGTKIWMTRIHSQTSLVPAGRTYGLGWMGRPA